MDFKEALLFIVKIIFAMPKAFIHSASAGSQWWLAKSLSVKQWVPSGKPIGKQVDRI